MYAEAEEGTSVTLLVGIDGKVFKILTVAASAAEGLSMYIAWARGSSSFSAATGVDGAGVALVAMMTLLINYLTSR